MKTLIMTEMEAYRHGISAHDRELLHNIIRQFPELRYASQWCKYHRSEWLFEQARLKTRAA